MTWKKPKWFIDLEIHLDKNVDKVQEVEEDGVVQLAQLLLPVHVLPGVQLLDSLHNIQMTELCVRHEAYTCGHLHNLRIQQKLE